MLNFATMTIHDTETTANVPRAMVEVRTKHRLFVQEYLVDLKAREAAIRAGYSPASAHVTASRLFANPRVREAITASIEDRFGVTKASIVEELSAMAFANLGDHYAWDEGRIRSKPSRNMTKSQQRAIASIRRVQTPTGSIIEVRLPDKLRALELLARLMGALGDPLKDSLARHL